MRRLAVIPARYASSRFPAKPLAELRGKCMIMWVYDAVAASALFDRVVVATDDERIERKVRECGGDVMMTSKDCSCGTQRCDEVLATLERAGEYYDLVVNVQGDEPLIKKEQLEDVVSLFENRDCRIATLAKRIECAEDLFSPDCVKVVFAGNRAIYFSRSVIPYLRGVEREDYLKHACHYKHIGLYAYRSETLHEIVRLPLSTLEKAESLEQLRWLEKGLCIFIKPTAFESFGVDTPEDLERINRMLE